MLSKRRHHGWNRYLKTIVKNIARPVYNLLVALSILHVLRLFIESAENAKNVSSLKRHWAADLHECSEAEETAEKSLRLDKIITHGDTLFSSEKDIQEYFLHIGILINNVEKGCLEFFPPGTRILFDKKQISPKSSVTDVKYIEYNAADSADDALKADDEKKMNDGHNKEYVTARQGDAKFEVNGIEIINNVVTLAQSESKMLASMLMEDEIHEIKPESDGDNEVPNVELNDKSGSLFGTARNIIVGQDLDFMNKETEPLFTEGFLERVNRVKTEIFDSENIEALPADQPFREFQLNCLQACEISPKINVVFLINTSPEAKVRRQRIRKTFLHSKFTEPFKVVHVFLLGKAVSPLAQQVLNYEQWQHADLVQGDFVDAPENDTMKIVMGMHWVVQYCHNAELVFKTEDDVFVDTYKILNAFVPAARPVMGKRAMFCVLNSDGFIPYSRFKSLNVSLSSSRTLILPYCKAFAVLMTRHVISSFLAASHHVPNLNIEDFYLYGILPYLSGGVEVYDLGKKRGMDNIGLDAIDCYRNLKERCPIIASWSTSSRFHEFWEYARNQSQNHIYTYSERSYLSLWNLQSYRTYFVDS